MEERQEDYRPTDAITDPERMGASQEGGEEGSDLGAIRIHNNVIATIARIAALKVPGVVDMSGNLVDGIAGIMGKKIDDRGVRVEINEDGVVLEVHVVLAYGARIPQVSWQVQNDVREAVEQMTGKAVTAVNVVVQSVRMPGEGREGASQ